MVIFNVRHSTADLDLCLENFTHTHHTQLLHHTTPHTLKLLSLSLSLGCLLPYCKAGMNFIGSAVDGAITVTTETIN